MHISTSTAALHAFQNVQQLCYTKTNQFLPKSNHAIALYAMAVIKFYKKWFFLQTIWVWVDFGEGGSLGTEPDNGGSEGS